MACFIDAELKMIYSVYLGITFLHSENLLISFPSKKRNFKIFLLKKPNINGAHCVSRIFLCVLNLTIAVSKQHIKLALIKTKDCLLLKYLDVFYSSLTVAYCDTLCFMYFSKDILSSVFICKRLYFSVFQCLKFS